MWHKEDPRFSINKRANIIIVDRRSEYPSQWKICFAHVDTKEVYCIFTEWNNYKCMDADAEWVDGWVWTYAPEDYILDKEL